MSPPDGFTLSPDTIEQPLMQALPQEFDYAEWRLARIGIGIDYHVEVQVLLPHLAGALPRQRREASDLRARQWGL